MFRENSFFWDFGFNLALNPLRNWPGESKHGGDSAFCYARRIDGMLRLFTSRSFLAGASWMNGYAVIQYRAIMGGDENFSCGDRCKMLKTLRNNG